MARQRKELSLEEIDEALGEAEEPSAAVKDHHLRLDLAEALKQLKSKERAAILLCCQNGLSHEEAAGFWIVRSAR